MQVSTPDDVTTGVAQGVYDAGITTANSAYAAKDAALRWTSCGPTPGAVAIYGPIALATHSADSTRSRRTSSPSSSARTVSSCSARSGTYPTLPGVGGPTVPHGAPVVLPRLDRHRRATRTPSSRSTSRSSAAEDDRAAVPRPRPAVTATGVVLALVAALVALPLLPPGPGGVAREPAAAGPPSWLSRARRRRYATPSSLAAAVTVTAVPLGVAMALSCAGPTCPAGRSGGSRSSRRWSCPTSSWATAGRRPTRAAASPTPLLGLHWAGLLGPVGVWLVLVVNAAPLAYLVAAVGLAARAEPDGERAARVSGAGPARPCSVTVTLRLLLPPSRRPRSWCSC